MEWNIKWWEGVVLENRGDINNNNMERLSVNYTNVHLYILTLTFFTSLPGSR